MKKYCGGSERKEGIEIDGADYMIKYQKQTAFGKRNNHISEFIGSHIFALCGFDVHKTYLGCRNGEQVVACKDFNVKGVQFPQGPSHTPVSVSPPLPPRESPS